LFETFK